MVEARSVAALALLSDVSTPPTPALMSWSVICAWPIVSTSAARSWSSDADRFCARSSGRLIATATATNRIRPTKP